MPQLNPSPWLIILFFSWLTLVIIIPVVLTLYMYPNEIILETLNECHILAWFWPW